MSEIIRSVRISCAAALVSLVLAACGGSGGFDVTLPSSGDPVVSADCQTAFNPALIGVSGQDCRPVYHKFCDDVIPNTPATSLPDTVSPCVLAASSTANRITVTTGSVTANGLTSAYSVIKPVASSGGKALVIALHWQEASGPAFADYMRMAELSVGRNVTVVLPTAPQSSALQFKTWGDPTSLFPVTPADVDKIALLNKLVSQLSSQGFVSSPLQVIGISGGAVMAYKFSCAQENVSGVELVAAEITQSDLDACKRTVPLGTVQVQGTQDSVATAALAADPAVTFQKLYAINGCAASGIKTASLPPISGEAVTSIDFQYFTSCTSGKASSLVTIVKGGHTWPGMDQNNKDLPTNLFGNITHGFDATLQGYDLLLYLNGH